MSTQRDRMLAGDEYLADDPEIQRELRLAARRMERFNATTTASETRARRLRALLGSLGDGSQIRPPFFVDYGKRIHIGARVFANYNLVALDVATITIGDDVQIGPNVQLLTPIHPLDAERRRAKFESAKPITIGNNMWLGGGVIVLPGVTIGDDTVVGAGAVVTRDLPAGVVAAGVPARVIRERSSADDARDAEPGVDVLALDLPVLDREDVDAVPLERLAVARRRRRPLVHDEALVHVQPAAAELDVGVVAEDLRDVLAHRLGSLGALARGVVVEHDVGRVHRGDRVEVVRVPRVVVALDQLAFVHSRAALLNTRSSPTRRVSPSAS